MYKNVSLRTRCIDGIPTWMLLGPDGRAVAAFDAFAHSLRKTPKNTRDSYCRHLAEFLDYLIEVTLLVGQGRMLTKHELMDALEAYGDYLRLGADASTGVTRQVAAILQPAKNKPASVTPKKAAVRRFLRLSEDIRKEMAEISRAQGHDRTLLANEPLFPALDQRRALRPNEMRAMQTHSMMAGVIAGGPKLIKAVILDEETDDVRYDPNRAFPYDKVLDFIDAMPTFRNKTFYSLLAATGCRTHEGEQLLTEDVDVLEGDVRLVDPASRPSHQSYLGLTRAQRDLLAWKGRTSDLTLLIEPFATLFFESLQKYLEKEHIPHGKHDFVFQYLKGPSRGMPYFLSSSSTRLELFHRVCKHIGVKLPPGTGPHSFRHMYGTYALNYFPRANGDYGLPVPIVQQLLGHSDVKSTLKYARFDKDLLKLETQNANRVLFRHGTPRTLLQLKLDALEAQIEKVRAQLAQEGLTHA